MERRTYGRRTALALACLLATPAARGGARTDGTVGAKATLGGQFTVDASLGRQVGGNLFHSFQTFDLSRGESATFTGPATVHNVIARVTGGGSSQVDGLLRCTIPNADFYFINPAGIAFGPDAQLDVKGSVALTTADYVRLSDAGQFMAKAAPAKALSAAPPSAFGFLSSHGAAFTAAGNNTVATDPVTGRVTITTVGQPIRAGANAHDVIVAAGSVQISGRTVESPGGRVQLVAVRSSGKLKVNTADTIDTGDFAALGPVSLGRGALLAASGNGGGRVEVRGSDVTLDGATIQADVVGSDSGHGIDVAARSSITLDHAAVLSARTFGPARGGDVKLRAATVDVRNLSAIATVAANRGAGGDVDIGAGRVTLDDALVDASTVGRRSGGDVRVVAGHFTMVDASVTAATVGAGAGGDVRIDAGDVSISGGPSLSQFPEVSAVVGASGHIPHPPAIDAGSLAVKNGGRAGGISITARDAIALDDVATLSTSSSVNGGSIDLSAGTRIVLNRGSAVSSFAGLTGGDVTMSAPLFVSLAGGSAVSTNAGGHGGDVSVDPIALSLGRGSSITANGGNQGGNVSLSADALPGAVFRGRGTNVTASGRLGTSGSVATNPARNDVAQAIMRFVAGLLPRDVQLLPRCGESGSFSSFVETGRGGVALEPGTWGE